MNMELGSAIGEDQVKEVKSWEQARSGESDAWCSRAKGRRR